VRPARCQAFGCGGPGLHRHHDRYDRPLDVVFLCRDCHRAAHSHGPQRLKPSARFARAPRPEPALAA
jgi:hypothetical protein